MPRGVLPQCGLGDENRVHTAEFAIEGYWRRAAGGDVGQGAARRGRAGERRSAHPLIAQRGDGVVTTLDEGEHAVWQPGTRQCLGDDPGGRTAQSWVAFMGLDDDRVSRRQRGRGVATGDREGKREVRRGKDEYRAHRDVDATHIRPRPDDVVGIGVVDTRVEVGALRDNLGEKPQLPCGAP